MPPAGVGLEQPDPRPVGIERQAGVTVLRLPLRPAAVLGDRDRHRPPVLLPHRRLDVDADHAGRGGVAQQLVRRPASLVRIGDVDDRDARIEPGSREPDRLPPPSPSAAARAPVRLVLLDPLPQLVRQAALRHEPVTVRREPTAAPGQFPQQEAVARVDAASPLLHGRLKQIAWSNSFDQFRVSADLPRCLSCLRPFRQGSKDAPPCCGWRLGMDAPLRSLRGDAKQRRQ